MSPKTKAECFCKIIFIGNGVFKYNSRKTKKREQFIKNEIKNVSKEDGEYLLSLKEKGCKCHTKEDVYLFMAYAQWKEYMSI